MSLQLGEKSDEFQLIISLVEIIAEFYSCYLTFIDIMFIFLQLATSYYWIAIL
jgi:hypothetical protein